MFLNVSVLVSSCLCFCVCLSVCVCILLGCMFACFLAGLLARMPVCLPAFLPAALCFCFLVSVPPCACYCFFFCLPLCVFWRGLCVYTSFTMFWVLLVFLGIALLPGFLSPPIGLARCHISKCIGSCVQDQTRNCKCMVLWPRICFLLS